MDPSMNCELADTGEFPALDKKATASAGAGRVRVDGAGLSHRGLVRPNNEDHFLVARFGRFFTPLSTNVRGQADTVFEEEGHGLVVADGLGGAAAGEVASDLAIRSLLNLVFETSDWIISPAGSEADRVMKRMAERYRRIDDLLVQAANRNPHLRGMGTTMTLACNVGDSLILTHVGDSRAYLYRNADLYQLTHDHTLAQVLVDQGSLRHVEEASKQMQHTLVRLLGGVGQQCEADVEHLTLLDQDVVVLCTDGLTDMVNDDAIAAILAAGAPAEQTCQTLVDTALKNGGKDNVTVIVARYGFFGRPSAK